MTDTRTTHEDALTQSQPNRKFVCRRQFQHMRTDSRVRGFTLLELLIALTCAAVIMTAAMTTVTTAIKESNRGRAERNLVREGEFVALVIQRSIERAGMGVPDGLHLDDGNPDPILPIVFAGADTLGVVGDFARPHANYPTLGTLHSRAGGDKTRIAYHTENNGTCVPNTAPPTCSIADASIFFPGDTTPCNAAGNFNNRTCAWGLRRLAQGDWIQIAGGLGEWTNSRVSNTLEVNAGTAFLKLAIQYEDSTNLWPNLTGSDAPAGSPGHNIVTTLDRVFFRYVSGTRSVERKQCWGPPDTAAAWWPPQASGSLPATLDSPPDMRCTPWEVILRNVDAVSFTYFDGGNGAPATQADIRRVGYRIELSDNVAGQTLRYVVTGSGPIARGT